ncbi:Type I fatty acid synthase, partial [Cryptosporidium felis]
AAALPVVSTTVEYSLRDIANIKKGDKVLVHAVTGGVGLMVVQYCKAIGATVYGTAGNETKVEYAKSIGVEKVSSSRDASKFKLDMEELEGEIDIVVNSLIDEFIPSSLKLLKEGGCFIELGKRGTWTEEEMKEKRPDIKYKIVAVDAMMESDPAWFGGMLLRVKSLVENGTIKSLPLKIFNMRGSNENGIDAFRYMQRAQHI